MRILQLCNKPPFPPVDGGAIAMNNITQGLIKSGHDVKVLSVTTDKHPVNISELPDSYKLATKFEAVFIDTSIRIQDAFFNLFSNKSYNVERFISVDFTKKLESVLKNNAFDIVLIESLFVAPYIDTIKANSKAKIVLRAHNVEHLIWERMSVQSTNPVKKTYLSFLAKRLKQYESSILNELDGLCAMTAIDQKLFEKIGFKQASSVVPTGYIIQDESTDIIAEPNSVFHIASMDWLPNIEGIDWFLNKVWDLVIQKNKQVKLYLAGREMPERYYNLKKSSIVTVGPVKDAKSFYQTKKIMVVPVLSGSGMRIKIIEGMALGKVIIATTIGAEGIDCTHNKNIIIANTPLEFAEAILKCCEDQDFVEEIGRNAQDLIREKYSNEAISERLVNYFNQLME